MKTHVCTPPKSTRIFLFLFAACLCARILPAQNAPAREQIDAAEAAVGKAIHTQDFTTLKKIWSPLLLVNSPGNNVLNRDQVFAAMRQGELKYSKYENAVESFQAYGEVAVVMGHEVVVPDFGPEIGKTFYRRYTDVWQRTGGFWVMISRQATYTTKTHVYAAARVAGQDAAAPSR